VALRSPLARARPGWLARGWMGGARHGRPGWLLLARRWRRAARAVTGEAGCLGLALGSRCRGWWLGARLAVAEAAASGVHGNACS
jgi:hypothetical protein